MAQGSLSLVSSRSVDGTGARRPRTHGRDIGWIYGRDLGREGFPGGRRTYIVQEVQVRAEFRRFLARGQCVPGSPYPGQRVMAVGGQGVRTWVRLVCVPERGACSNYLVHLAFHLVVTASNSGP